MSPLTQSLLDKRPEQSLFVIYIIYQIPARWRMFGIHLDIKVNRLDAISEKDPEECFLKVYDIWENEMTKPFTWRTAVEVLEILNQNRLRRQVMQKIAEQSSQTEI